MKAKEALMKAQKLAKVPELPKASAQPVQQEQAEAKVIDLKPKHAPGSQVKIDSGEGVVIRAAEATIGQLHSQLGALSAQFEAAKGQILASIGKASQDYITAVHAVASKHGIDPTGQTGEKWEFDVPNLVFKRTA